MWRAEDHLSGRRRFWRALLGRGGGSGGVAEVFGEAAFGAVAAAGGGGEADAQQPGGDGEGVVLQAGQFDELPVEIVERGPM